MQVKDIFQANDWEIRHLLVVILSLLLSFWGSIYLDMLGFSIPLLRQITGFFLLTFVPGTLILRILQIHNLGAVRTTIYAIGLSLSTLMFTGFFVNMTYPLFGIFRPLSLWPLSATISVLVGFLCFFAWFRDWDFATPTLINLHEIFSPPVLALSLLPFGAIAGTYLMNFHGTNSLQMIILPIIALVPVVIVCTRFIPEKYYPYAIFTLAITLLYHTALISTHVWGWDIQYEYYLTNTVIQNSIWDFTDYSTCNAMLSLMTLAPIYSILLGTGVEWVFKVIYPFFFALVPVGLYVVFRKQTNEKISFLACFFFMSLFVFYTEMVSLARQEIAELFLVLILLSMIDHGLSRQMRSIFLLTFTASLVVSHYGLSYIFMLLLLIALAITTIDYHVDILGRVNRFLNWIRERTGRFTGLTVQMASFKPSIIPLSFIIWYSLFLLAWYIYVASSSSFDTVVHLAHPILENILSDLFNPDAAQGMAIIVKEAATPLHEVAKYLHLLTIFFIVVGFVVTLITRQKEINLNTRFFLLSCGALGICIGGVALPFFASALNTSRLYQISLILLAPFGVIGGIFILDVLYSQIVHERSEGLYDLLPRSLQVFAIFLTVFLLFNSGWVYEFCNDAPTSFALNSSLDSPVFSKQEISGALWLGAFKDDSPVAADSYRRLLLSSIMGRGNCHVLQVESIENIESYLFMGHYNIFQMHITTHRISGVTMLEQQVELSDINILLNTVYDCGGAKIHSPQKRAT